MSAINNGVNRGINEYIKSQCGAIKLRDRVRNEISDEVKELTSAEIERLITTVVRQHYDREVASLVERIDSKIDKRFAVLTDGDLSHWIEQRAKFLIEKAMKS